MFPLTPVPPPVGAAPPPETPSATAVPTALSATNPPTASSAFRRDQPRSSPAGGQERWASTRITGRRIAWVSASGSTGSRSAS